MHGSGVGLVDLGKAFDVVSTTINSYAKYRVLERALRNRVVVGLGVGTATGAYITDALGISGDRGKDLFTGDTYSALDFVTDKYTQLADKNILPVSENQNLPMNFGLRHRAAFGISEDTDALAIVISEEHGTISTFLDGKISSDLSIVNLRSIINEYLETDNELN